MTQGLCCCISKLLLVDYKSLSDYGAIWISPVTVCCVGTGGNTCFHYEAWPHSGWGEIRPSGLTSCWYPQGAWIYADINRSICFFVSELIRHQLWWLSEPQLVGNGHRVTLENFKCSLWPSSHPPVQEFAENLLNSGVHGAVMVLDPSFNTDSMATVLGIQSGKHMVRRHLVEEMKALIGSARWEETITYRDTRRDPTACRSDSLKGQFSQKSKIYIFSLTCDAIHPFRLFLWWRLLKIIHKPCFGTVLSTNTPNSGYKVNYLAYLSKTYTKQSRYIGSTTGKRKKHAYFYILGWTAFNFLNSFALQGGYQARQRVHWPGNATNPPPPELCGQTAQLHGPTHRWWRLAETEGCQGGEKVTVLETDMSDFFGPRTLNQALSLLLCNRTVTNDYFHFVFRHLVYTIWEKTKWYL